jgi:hypothetical protein
MRCAWMLVALVALVPGTAAPVRAAEPDSTARPDSAATTPVRSRPVASAPT